ncbi:MAG: acylneuraminate cytidylyltransferase family protein [Muribaculaceae bacterium]|nr:acylneuraminate cytidylyltransferase family protein [Muribaculaceae bacterium]
MVPLVIIPARGGSKGIPHKNIVDLCGRPLIAYTIDVAKQIAPVCNILLSTDDPQIAATAEAEGLEIKYMRPAELATDTAGSREVILHAMDWADNNAINYNCVVLLQPTSPLRTVEDIKGAMSKYSPSVDMVVTVKDASSNPYYNCFEINRKGVLKISKGKGLYTRRQDAPPAYEYNGAVYVINPQSIRNMPMGSFPRKIPSIMPQERSVDIDSNLDLAIASILMQQNND